MIQENNNQYSVVEASIKDHFDEVLPLIKSHFNEISYHNNFGFNLDKEFYIKSNELGSIKFFILKDGDKIVGYSSYFLHIHSHCGIVQATQDALYVSPDYRKLGLGSKLIEYADKVLKDMKVSVVFQCVSKKNDFSNSLNKLGYELVDYLYARRL